MRQGVIAFLLMPIRFPFFSLPLSQTNISEEFLLLSFSFFHHNFGDKKVNSLNPLAVPRRPPSPKSYNQEKYPDTPQFLTSYPSTSRSILVLYLHNTFLPFQSARLHPAAICRVFPCGHEFFLRQQLNYTDVLSYDIFPCFFAFSDTT